MIDVVDFSKWDTYDGNAEGSGRSEKEWLSLDGKMGLFKYPKSEETTEHISEKLASSIANLLDIPCAEVDIGIYQNRIGSMSYRINQDNEFLVEGISFITQLFPDYDKDILCDNNTKYYYSLYMINPIIKLYGFEKQFAEMLIFDALIGNTDRHHSNWAFILSASGKLKFCPLYDNGSSLCCYIKESDIDSYLGKDLKKADALVTTKSRTRIRLNPLIKKEPTHIEVLEYLNKAEEYNNYCRIFVKKINQTLTRQKICDMLWEYPDNILSAKRKNLIYLFLTKKINIINNIFKGG